MESYWLATAREAGVTRLLPQVMRALGLAYARAERAKDGILLIEEGTLLEEIEADIRTVEQDIVRMLAELTGSDVLKR